MFNMLDHSLSRTSLQDSESIRQTTLLFFILDIVMYPDIKIPRIANRINQISVAIFSKY